MAFVWREAAFRAMPGKRRNNCIFLRGQLLPAPVERDEISAPTESRQLSFPLLVCIQRVIKQVQYEVWTWFGLLACLLN